MLGSLALRASRASGSADLFGDGGEPHLGEPTGRAGDTDGRAVVYRDGNTRHPGVEVVEVERAPLALGLGDLFPVAPPRLGVCRLLSRSSTTTGGALRVDGGYVDSILP